MAPVSKELGTSGHHAGHSQEAFKTRQIPCPLTPQPGPFYNPSALSWGVTFPGTLYLPRASGPVNCLVSSFLYLEHPSSNPPGWGGGVFILETPLSCVCPNPLVASASLYV